MNTQGLVVHFLSIIGLTLFAFVITCLASPRWGCDRSSNFCTGLNTYCNGSMCDSYTKDEKVGYLFATLFFIWTSLFISFFGCVVSGILSFNVIKKGIVLQMKILSAVLAMIYGALGLSMLVAMSCFSAGYAGFYYEFPYYLGWGAFATSTILSLTLCIVRLVWNYVSPEPETGSLSDFDINGKYLKSKKPS